MPTADTTAMDSITFWKLVLDKGTGTYIAMPYIRIYSGMVEWHLSPCQLRDERKRAA